MFFIIIEIVKPKSLSKLEIKNSINTHASFFTLSCIIIIICFIIKNKLLQDASLEFWSTHTDILYFIMIVCKLF